MYSYPSFALVQSFSSPSLLPPPSTLGTAIPPPLSMSGMAVPLLFLLPILTTTSAHPKEGSALLRLKSTLSGPSASLPTSIPNATPCLINHTKWEGVVICFNGRIWGLHLVDMGFTARLQLSPLVNLHGLRTLSILGNDLEGPMPDLSRLGALKAVYFSNNSFPGKIHDMTLRSPECAPLKGFSSGYAPNLVLA